MPPALFKTTVPATVAGIAAVKPEEGRGNAMYSLLADAVIVVHLLFIAFVVAGGLLVVRRPKATFAHLPAALWGAFIEFSQGICPLTPLENYLRQQGGQSAYSGDFVVRYIIPVIYPSGLTALVQYILGGLVVAISLAVYYFALRRHFLKNKKIVTGIDR